MVNFRPLIIAIGLVCATPAVADCFDTPTWHGEPLTQAFVDGLPEGSEHKVRRASLTMLLMAAETAGEQRKELKRLLTRTALLQHDGDKGALRKRLKGGTLHDVIQLIDFPRSRGVDHNRIIDAYWLNGCVEEALKLLVLQDRPPAAHAHMPIATGDSALLRTLADREEPGGFVQKKLLTFARLFENPETREEILQDFLDFLTASAPDGDIDDWPDGPGVKIALDLVRGKPLDLKKLPTMPKRVPLGLGTFMRQHAAFVAWVSAAGFCETGSGTSFVLLGTSNEDMPYYREILEASVIRCLVTQND